MTTVKPFIEATGGCVWPVDGHVHFHESSRVPGTLDAAAANMLTFGTSRRGLIGALLLAQAERERVFEALRETGRAGDWLFTPSEAEAESLIARKQDLAVVIVCGRQVRTNDGLEVLAIGTCRTFDDGQSLEAALDAVSRTNAVPVIPWGFGKTWGKRGSRIERLLTAGRIPELFVGDNGSRLDMLGVPEWINDAQQRGYRVLPGSDPFPLGDDHIRAGSFGFLAPLVPDATAPWLALRNWLVAGQGSPAPYGRASGIVRFVRNQVGIQVRNRASALRKSG